MFNFSSVVDTDPSLQSKGSGKFGLNSGHITKFAFNPNGGKDGSPLEVIDLTVEIEGRDYFCRLFPPTGTLRYGNASVNPGDADYEKAFNSQMTQIVATVKHVVKAFGITDDQINLVVASATDFKSFFDAITTLIPGDFSTKPVDCFLEYQWTISEGQNKTYPTLPSNMKGGKFLCPSVAPVGSWKPVTDSDGSLHYEDDSKNVHPFMRSASFMNSNKGKQQDLTAGSNLNLGGNSSATIW